MFVSASLCNADGVGEICHIQEAAERGLDWVPGSFKLSSNSWQSQNMLKLQPWKLLEWKYLSCTTEYWKCLPIFSFVQGLRTKSSSYILDWGLGFFMSAETSRTLANFGDGLITFYIKGCVWVRNKVQNVMIVMQYKVVQPNAGSLEKLQSSSAWMLFRFSPWLLHPSL